jgi:hypothetical protein
MTLTKFLLWPGNKACLLMGVDPSKDAGLIRWMFNTLFYLCILLAVTWAILG